MIKAEVVVNAGLGVLMREATLPGLVWRDAVGDFAGAKNDTISIRVPAYAPAKSRKLRSGASRDRDDLFERKVDVTLTDDVYKDVKISDELLSLDIANFGTQVLNPVMAGVAQKLEDILGDAIAGATYQHSIALNEADPFATAVEARRLLNLANVPSAGRRLLCGANVEAAFLGSEKFSDAMKAGSTQTLREGQIGRVVGFDVYPSNAIDPDKAYAFHQTAYVLSNRAPQVPAGAPFGQSASSGGFALRVVRVLDSATIEDILAVDSWIGANVVTDFGAMDGDAFAPGTLEDSGSGETDLFVRSIEISLASS